MSLPHYLDVSSAVRQREGGRIPDIGLNGCVVLTVVLPLFNEETVLAQMYQRLKAVAEQLDLRYELLFVDDGSTDRTTDLILDIARRDACVSGVFFSRHFGKEAALVAGLRQARGQAAIIMDADLQDPPELIPQMLQAWRDGAEVVRMRPCQPEASPPLQHIGHSFLARLRNMARIYTMPRHGLDFMLYSQRAVTALSLVVNRKRYMKEMFEWAGCREAVIEYERHPRVAGASKWSWAEMLGHSPDGTKTFVNVFLRLLKLAGLSGFLGGLLYACYFLVGCAFLSAPYQAVSLGSAALLLFSGASLFLLAWFGEMIEQICPSLKRPRYSIKMFVRHGCISLR